MKLRIRKIERGEYFIEQLNCFDSWRLIAVVYDYKLARRFVKSIRTK